MYNLEALFYHREMTAGGIIVFGGLILWFLYDLTKHKENQKESKIGLAIAVVFLVMSISSLVYTNNAIKNSEFSKFKGSLDFVIGASSPSPEYHFNGENGENYIVFASHGAIREITNGEGIEEGKTYIVHYEVNSNTIVGVEEVE